MNLHLVKCMGMQINRLNSFPNSLEDVRTKIGGKSSVTYFYFFNT